MNSRSLSSSRRWGRRARVLHAIVALASLGFSLSACGPADIGTCNGGGGRNVNLCLGFSLASPNVTDGVIKGDTGWTNAFHYTLGDGNGTTVASVIFHGARNANTLFLGFEVHNDTQFNVNDAIVLVFDPDGTAADRRRIHIFPVFAAGASQNGEAQKIEYWKGSDNPDWTNPNTAPVNPTPTWLTNNIRVTSDNTQGNHYYVEIGIPIVAGANDPGINLPAGTDDFGFYFTVFDAVTTGMATNIVSEHSWPVDNHVGAFIEETPAPGTWGNGTLGRLTNGVSVTRLFTNQTPDTNINTHPGTENRFYATVENKMVDKNGAHLAAHGVRAEFRIKNYGIPSATEWDLLPSSPNPAPSAAGTDIAGNSANIESRWTLTAAQRITYTAHPDQCMRVEIFSNGPDTLIVQNRGYANMHFVDTASPFDEKARIGIKGYRLPEGQREHEFLLTEYRYNTTKPSDWTSQLTNVQPFNGGGPFPQYLLRVPPNEDQGADISARVTPPGVKIPREIVKLPPGSGGDVRVKVTPGNIVTVFSSGSIVLRRGDPGPGGQPTGPNGENFRGERESSYRGKYLLNEADAPDTRVGAVVASTDGFRGVSFVIGRATTFQVPQGATELALAINDTADGLKRQGGEGYRLEVIQTPADETFRHTTTLLDRRIERNVTILPLGQNLPTWIICGQRRTGGTLTIHGTKYDRYDNVGCFGSIVKSIGGL